MLWPRLWIAVFLPALVLRAAPSHAAPKPSQKGAPKASEKSSQKSAPKPSREPAPKPVSKPSPAATVNVPRHLKTLADAGASSAARLAAARALAKAGDLAAVRSAVATLQPQLAADAKAVLPVLSALGPEAVAALAPSVHQPGEPGQLALEAVQAVLVANDQAKPPAPLTPGAKAALNALVPVLVEIIETTPGPKAGDNKPADEDAKREAKERLNNHRRRVLPALTVLRFAGADAEPAIPVLQKQLKSRLRSHVWRHCVRALAAIGPAALPVLEPLAANEKFPHSREAGAAIDKIEDALPPRPLDPALAKQLQKLKSAGATPEERRTAAAALRRGGRPAVRAVVPLLADADPAVRSAAAEALEGTAAARAVPALSKLFLDPRTTRAATHALLRTGPDGVAALGKRLDEFDGQAYPAAVLAEALKAVAEHRPPADLAPRLGGMLTYLPAELVGHWIDAVAVKASPEAAAQLKIVAMAQAQYPLAIRRRAAAALAEFGDAGRVALRELAKDRDPDVANPAREALGMATVEHPIDAIAKKLEAPDRATRLAALEQLRAAQGQQQHGARAKQAMVRALKTADEEVRARTLGYFGSGSAAMPEGVDAVALLRDPSPVVRRAAVAAFRAFAVTGAEPVMELVRLSRDDRSEAVRKEAANVLTNLPVGQDAEQVRTKGGVHAAVVLPALLRKLKSPEPGDRRLAALALAGRLGTDRPEVAGALKPLLDDSDARVRAAAVEGLLPANISRSADWVTPLADLFNHREGDVRLAAADRVYGLGLPGSASSIQPELVRIAADAGSSTDARLYAAALLWAHVDRAQKAANPPPRSTADLPFDLAREGLRHRRRWVRQGAALALLSGPRAAEGQKIVTGVINDPHPEVAADAASVLTRRFTAHLAAVGPATRAQADDATLTLSDPDPVTRRNTAVGLARQGASAAGLAHLLAAAAEREQNPAVRRAMCNALSTVLGQAFARPSADAPNPRTPALAGGGQ